MQGCLLAASILVLAAAVDGGYSSGSGCGDAEVCAGVEAKFSSDGTLLVQMPARGIKFDEKANATREEDCMPPFVCTGWCDEGYDDSFKGWYDVQGCGQCNDYCRWVGGSGSGGDPEEKTDHESSFWSCRLAGGTATHTPWGTYPTWDLPKCAGEGASPPVPGSQECMPPFVCTGWCDEGYPDNFNGWYDVQGCGQCNDYCRWVGGSGSGGDPEEKTEHENSFWSCRLAGSTATHTPRGTYPTWDLPKCAGEGASPPPPATPYVPGEPGAAWTTEEMLAVRAKLHRVIIEGDQIVRELTNDWSLSGVLPNAGATMLRLGFHDCLKYADGTGGCDGCLEWKGVGDRFETEDLQRGLFPADVGGDGHNNGLETVVQVLEGIYTQQGFPTRTPFMALSLQQGGKSRADLWAFAAMVAVEYSLDLNNQVCAEPEPHKEWPWGQCHPRQGLEDCVVTAPRALTFETGRRDCLGDVPGEPAYATTKEERHPNPETTGRGTVEFFGQEFGFNGRETVAIMGGHTLGQLNVHHSLFRYTWKTNSGKLLNNGYFRNMARKRDWYFPSGEDRVACKHVGDEVGERPPARWMPHVRGDTEVGGPVQWLQEKLVCGNYDLSSIEVDTCEETDLEWKFVNGIDETMLTCEIGLYLDFDVDAHGIPLGCPGFEEFNMEGWGGWHPDGGLLNWWNRWTRIDGERAEPQCPFQTLAEPASDQPLHQIVESYADSTERWLEDFFPTLEKMLANGYADGALQAAPAEGMSGVSCPFPTADDIRYGRNQYTCTHS